MRRGFTLAGCMLAMLMLFGGTRADAQAVHFHFVGGHWSHDWHRGWHRYWGGPSIGFYYAAAPVYVVEGYPDPECYVGPDFWYANPAFGLSVNIGGGGGYWHDRGVYVDGGRWHDHPGYVDGGRWHDRSGYADSGRWHDHAGYAEGGHFNDRSSRVDSGRRHDTGSIGHSERFNDGRRSESGRGDHSDHGGHDR